jgi:hypothetical protein
MLSLSSTGGFERLFSQFDQRLTKEFHAIASRLGACHAHNPPFRSFQIVNKPKIFVCPKIDIDLHLP